MMADIVSVFIVSVILALYVIMRIVYPKDKGIAGFMIMMIGVLLISNATINTRDDIEVRDMDTGELIDTFRIDTNSSFNPIGKQTASFGLIIMVAGLALIVREAFRFYDESRKNRRRKR